MIERQDIVLTGCTPSPLSSYLKGIGLLRLVSRRDTNVRAKWRGEYLVLISDLQPTEMRAYLLDDYRPTPILAPWNGGSGFYDKDNKVALHAIAAGSTARLADFRACLEIAERSLSGLDRSASPKGAMKNELLTRFRGQFPDIALDWFDAAILLSGDSARFPPLLGTGGNDGRLDFTNNFMRRLLDLMDADSGDATAMSRSWLDLALFADPAPGLVKNAIGQFAPGQVGGPNSTIGYEGKGGINPWDYVLMIEGALPFAAAAVRRNGQDGDGVLSYPFTVRATAAGAGNLGAGDAASARGELWMPLWSQPASYPEVRALLAEGRVALGTRPARDALDFVRALHRLAGYRGVDRFQRFGLLMRSGKAYLATPLERVQVTADPQSDWVDELEKGDWLSRFRRFSGGDNAANRFVTLRKRLEDLLFELVRRAPSAHRTQALLALLGEIQVALSSSIKARESVGPVPRLSPRWTRAADDGGTAYRIALALAGLHGAKGMPLPLRAQLFPVHTRLNEWIDAACAAKEGGNDPSCRIRLHVPYQFDLVGTLITLLERRLWIADRLDFQDKPLVGEAAIGLDDLDAFLRDSRMDPHIAAILPGLALCEIPMAQEHGSGDGPALAAVGLLKLVLTPDALLRRLTGLPQEQPVPVPPGLLPMLASGNPRQAHRAVEVAWHRLRGSGLAPAMPLDNAPEILGIDPRRVAASLLIPLTYGATGVMARAVLTHPDTSRDAA